MQQECSQRWTRINSCCTSPRPHFGLFCRHSARQWKLLQWTILGWWRYIRVRRTWKSVHLSWNSTQWREKLERSHSRSTAPAENPQPGRLSHFRKIRMIVMMKRRERRSKSIKMPSNVQFYETIWSYDWRTHIQEKRDEDDCGSRKRSSGWFRWRIGHLLPILLLLPHSLLYFSHSSTRSYYCLVGLGNTRCGPEVRNIYPLARRTRYPKDYTMWHIGHQTAHSAYYSSLLVHGSLSRAGLILGTYPLLLPPYFIITSPQSNVPGT